MSETKVKIDKLCISVKRVKIMQYSELSFRHISKLNKRIKEYLKSEHFLTVANIVTMKKARHYAFDNAIVYRLLVTCFTYDSSRRVVSQNNEVLYVTDYNDSVITSFYK